MSGIQKRRAHHDDLRGSTRRRRRSESQSSAGSSAERLPSPNVNSSSSYDAMVKRLVRLALASEACRRPIRRQDISEKVLTGPGASRQFKQIFDDANKRLRDVFGMNLVELPAKEKTTVAQKRAAQKNANAGQNASSERGGAAGSGTKSYILTSVLPRKYQESTTMQPSKTPSAEAEAAYAGLCTFVISAIMLSNGQRTSEGKLESYLQQANADEIFFGEKTEQVIKRMEREGYIDKIKEDEGTDYKVGPRGKLEIGDQGVAGMIATVFDKRGDDLKQLEDALERSLGVGGFERQTRKGQTNANGDSATNNTVNDDRDEETVDDQGTERRSSSRPLRRSRRGGVEHDEDE